MRPSRTSLAVFFSSASYLEMASNCMRSSSSAPRSASSKIRANMEATWKGLRGGAIVGLSLLAILALGMAVKLLTGASTEVIEWAGVIAIVLGFPISMLTESLTGPSVFVALLVAVVVNWALVGFLLGGLVAVVLRLQERKS